MTLVQISPADTPACTHVPEVCQERPAFPRKSFGDERTIPRLREPLTGASSTLRGRPSGPAETAAAAKGV